MNPNKYTDANLEDSDVELSDDDDDSIDGAAPLKIKSKKIPKERGEFDEDDSEEEEEDLDQDPDQDSDYEHNSDEEDEDKHPLGSKALLPRFADLDDESEEEEEEEDDHYLQKFDESTKHNIISEFHPEMQAHNSEEVDILATIVRNEMGVIIDPLHRTLPFITKYEKARILGERAKQLNSGARAFIEVEPTVIDGYLIALKEFEEKKIPFILKRPLPNGGCEYWRMKDLEIL